MVNLSFNGLRGLLDVKVSEMVTGTETDMANTTLTDAEKDKIEAFDLNVAGYLVKPVTFPGFAELMATLNKYWTLVDMP